MKAELTGKAKKQLARLPRNEQKKVINKLRVIEAYPFSGKALSGEYSGKYSFRAWPYRIFYLIDKKRKRAVIINIEHRQGRISNWPKITSTEALGEETKEAAGLERPLARKEVKKLETPN